MTNNIKKITILTIIMLLVLCILNLNSVIAATTTLSATANKTKVDSGATFTVTVKSSVSLTGWTISLKDNGGCTFSTATGGELTGTSIYGADLNGKTSLATYTFKAPTVTKETKYTISFSGSAMCDVDTNELTAANTPSVTVTVKPKTTDTNKDINTNNNTSSNTDATNTTPKEKSNNAYLKTLGVRITDKVAEEIGVKTDEYDFSGFSKTKTTYNVTVPKNVDSLKVFATAADPNATVKISGNSGFEVGTNNKITIKVTAEDGKTSKTYTIKVTQLAEEEKKPGNLIEDESDLYLTSLSIEGIELSPEFNKDTFSYTATLNDSNINELNVTAVSNIEEAKIEISGNTELVEGENTINILLTVEDSEVQKIYQIVVNKIVEATTLPTTTGTTSESSTTDIIGMFKGYVGIAVGVVLFMIIAVIVLSILLRRENKKTREDDEEYIEESGEVKAEEYNVYNNDENEFMDNEIEKDNFIESLYRQRNGNTYNEEELTEDDKETIEEINNQTEKIFEEKVEGQSVEYISNEEYDENPLEVRKKRRGKGKHSL